MKDILKKFHWAVKEGHKKKALDLSIQVKRKKKMRHKTKLSSNNFLFFPVSQQVGRSGGGTSTQGKNRYISFLFILHHGHTHCRHHQQGDHRHCRLGRQEAMLSPVLPGLFMEPQRRNESL